VTHWNETREIVIEETDHSDTCRRHCYNVNLEKAVHEMSQMTASLVVLTAEQTIEYMKKVPDGPNQGAHKFVHITRFSNADSIEAHPGAADSGIRRACAHNAMKQLAWIVRLCIDYVDWDLKHTRFKHGDDDTGFVGYVLEEDHPLVRLNCIRPSANGSRDAHLCTVDADISTNGLTRLNFSSHRQLE
jgi:hypothetical protein